jgi:hypothetical protein
VKLGELLAHLRDAAGGHGSFAVIGALARNAWAPPRATTDVERWARFWRIDDRLRRLRHD